MRAHARNELLEKDGSSQIGANGSILRRRVQEGRTYVPVIKTDAPVSNSSPKPLLRQIIQECGLTYLQSDTEDELLEKFALFLSICGTEVLIVDEIEHITRPEMKRRFLEMSNRRPNVPIICASCTPLQWTTGDIEVAGRWNDFFELRPYRGERLEQLLSFVDLILPFSQPSFLTLRAATQIERLTQGVLRDIIVLLWEACTRVIKGGQAIITPDVLNDAWASVVTRTVWNIDSPSGRNSRIA